MRGDLLSCARYGLAQYLRCAVRLLPGGIVCLLALSVPSLRHQDGWLTPLAGFLAVVGIALALLGLAWRTCWQRGVGLLTLALVGQACALQLISSPPYGVYQHYIPWRHMLTSHQGLFLGSVLAQTGLTVWAARGVWPAFRCHLTSLFTVPQSLVLLACMAFAGALLSYDVVQYGVELVLTGWLTALSVLNLTLAAGAMPAGALVAISRRLQYRVRVSVTDASPLPWDHLVPWLVAGWTTMAAVLLAWVVFERVPHLPDDVSYLFQAKYFATGRLYLPAPPDAASFVVGQVVNDGTKWFGYGFPGWPAVLALGVLAGVPWCVNPCLGGLTVLLTHVFLRRLYGWTLAHAVVLLMALSPWFLFMSASFMTHPLTVVWTLLVLLLAQKALAGGRGRWGALAGICLGALFLTRPLEGVLVGSAVALWVLWQRDLWRLRRALAAAVLAGVLVGGLVFPYNYVLTGDPTYAPHMKWTDETWYPGADRLGFGPHIGNVGWPHLDPLPGHGPLDVIINANKNFYMANFELFGWGFGSLGFAVLAVLWGRLQRADWLFVAIILAIVGGHSFYWCSGGPDFGTRYWYQLLIPLTILTVRGIHTVQQRLSERSALRLIASRVTTFVVLASLLAFINIMPWRSLSKYRHYRGMSADVHRLDQEHGFGRSLIFVQTQDDDYAAAFIFNAPALETSGPIYARDAGAAHREALQRHFPDRPVWFIGRAPGDAERLRVLAGPLPNLRGKP